MVAVILLGGMAVLILRDREPRYQGRTLTEWIWAACQAKDLWFVKINVLGTNRIIPVSGRFEEGDWLAARQAVKSMAPEAIPILLRWASARDLPRVAKAKEALNKFFGWHLNTQSAMPPDVKAYVGFQLLGADASPAWPTLFERTSSPDPRIRETSIVCLAETWAPEEKLKPILQRLKQGTDGETASMASVLDRCIFQSDARIDPVK